MGLSGFGPESPAPEAGRIPNYPTDPSWPYRMLLDKTFLRPHQGTMAPLRTLYKLGHSLFSMKVCNDYDRKFRFSSIAF